MSLSLEQSFSTLPAHWNHVGSFKDRECRALASGDTDLMDLGSSVDIDLSLKTESHCRRETVIGIQ